MTGTIFENTGLSVLVDEPILSTRAGGTQYSYTKELNDYTHKRSAFLDYDKALIELKGDHLDAEDWVEFGLGRDISVKDGGLDTPFNGFANSIEIVVGGLTLKLGPLLAIGNRVSAVYAVQDNTVNPPTVGDRTVTTIVEDDDSQAKYGIIEKVISAGQVSTADANQARDVYIDENNFPETSQGINSMGSGEGITIRLDCLGYGYWLKAFVYNQNVAAGTTQISDKIEAVLTAEAAGNAIISPDYSRIAFNGVLVTAYENDDPYGLTMIKELVAYGGPAPDYERYLFQLDQDRRVVYFEKPSEWVYQYAIEEGSIRTAAGAIVQPWAIRPGRWVFITDFLTGRIEDANIERDPRMVFIESVDYTAPYGFQIEGSKSNTFKQIISQFGMKGLIS